MAVDFTLVAGLVIGSFLLLAVAFFWVRFYKPASTKLTETTLRPIGKYGGRIMFGGMPIGAEAAPTYFEGTVLDVKTHNGKADVTIEHLQTKEVRTLKGLNWKYNVRSLTANTPNEAVHDTVLVTNCDWDNGFFPWNSITLEAFNASVDSIRDERLKSEVKKELDEVLEYRNIRSSFDDTLKSDRMGQYRNPFPPQP